MNRANYSLWTDNGIFDSVQAERDRQDQKWGVQHWPDGTDDGWLARGIATREKIKTDLAMKDGTLTWRDILQEEISEAFAEKEWSSLRVELIQSMAVIAAWIEDGDQRAHYKGKVDNTSDEYAPGLTLSDLPEIGEVGQTGKFSGGPDLYPEYAPAGLSLFDLPEILDRLHRPGAGYYGGTGQAVPQLDPGNTDEGGSE